MKKIFLLFLTAAALLALITPGCSKKTNLTGPSAPTSTSTPTPNLYIYPTALPTITGPGKFFGGSNTLTVNCIIPTSDNGFAISGVINYGIQGCIIKTDSSGSQQWMQTYGYTAYGMAQAPDDGFVFADGYTDVIKTDSSGGFAWMQNYFTGGVPLYWLTYVKSVPGGYAVADRYFKLLKIDASGNSIWAYDYDPAGTAWMLGFATASDGGFLMAGETYSGTMGYRDIRMVKADPGGVAVFDKIYGTITEDTASGVADLGAGYGIYGDTDFSPPHKDIFIMTDTAGIQTDFKMMGTLSQNEGYNGMDIIVSGGYCYLYGVEVCHTGSSPFYYSNLVLRKMDFSRNIIWTKYFYGSSGFDLDQFSLKMCAASDGGIVMAGTTRDQTGFYLQAFLMKVDTNGNRVW